MYSNFRLEQLPKRFQEIAADLTGANITSSSGTQLCLLRRSTSIGETINFRARGLLLLQIFPEELGCLKCFTGNRISRPAEKNRPDFSYGLACAGIAAIRDPRSGKTILLECSANDFLM